MDFISNAVIGWARDFICWILSAFPNADTSIFQFPDFSPFLLWANQFVNMPLLLSAVSFFVAYEVAIIGLRGLLWVWHQLLP